MVPPNERQTRRARLSAAQQALLERRLSWEENSAATTHTISRRPAGGPLPLSFAQQRLWFLDQLAIQPGAYNISLAARLSGPLRQEQLQHCLNILVQRHESLRTVFIEEEGNVVQRIKPTEPVALARIDLRSYPEEEQAAQLQQLLTQESQHAFQLTTGPLFRVVLIQLAAEEHVLFIGIHHIISDGWSQGILFRELSTLYSLSLTGRQAALPALPIQYADFACWQRTTQAPELEREEVYWQQQLAHTRPLELPLDYPRSALRSRRGARESVLLAAELSAQLKQWSQQSGSTLFMLLLTVLQVLLARYSGQDDICIGSSIANRSYEELEGVVGCFANTLVFRTKLAGDLTFLDLLEQVKQTALAAYAHQNLPFEKVVELVQPERDLSRSPLFQVMFILQNTPTTNLTLSGLTVQPMDLAAGEAKFDLTLSVVDFPEGLLCEIDYDTTLFKQQKIQRMFQHWQTLLKAVLSNPDRRIADIVFLAPEEWQQQIYTWNATQRTFPQAVCLHELFALQVASTPDAIAVYAGQQALTYAALWQRAQKLTLYLRAQGVQPGILVGMCLERTAEMLVAILGILAAGGAYLPLDPTYPPERLHFMLADSQASLLVTEEAFQPLFAHFSGQIINLPLGGASVDAHEHAVQHSPLQPAYVIYTSGSTGKPKGTIIPHHAVVNFLTSMSQQPGMTPQDCILAVTSLAFDISVLEICLPLIVGGSVELVSREIAADGEKLHACLDQGRATMMQATPATWRLLLGTDWTAHRSLKALCGGEPLAREMALSISERTSELWNMYGPTETTIWSMLEQITDEPELITIGRPLANTQVYILDQYLQPVPVGTIGEIYIGGEGLAQGYLACPDLTAERFVPDPFHTQMGRRLYRTGDLGRYLYDGRIECLGRADQQVKLRGFRIELGEIESCLEEHPAIQQCVALVRENQVHEPSLVAYLQAASTSPAPTPQELRAFLSQTLPAYMLPAHFCWLQVFPLTPNGKIDRKAFPLPEQAGGSIKSRKEPATPLEVELCQMWSEILGLDAIGVDDNFFELGGHSLLGMRLTAQIRQAFQIKLPLVALFNAPTVADLALVIEDILLTEIEQLDELEAQQSFNMPMP